MSLAILEITPNLIVDILKGVRPGYRGHYEVVENPLPKDATFEEMTMGREYLHVLLRSDSFPPIVNGVIPLLPSPVIKSISEPKDERHGS